MKPSTSRSGNGYSTSFEGHVPHRRGEPFVQGRLCSISDSIRPRQALKYLTAALFALGFAASAAHAREPVVAFRDPPNDDFGAGATNYPVRGDYLKGDLDLRHFQIERDDQGFWFEAEFSNVIRDPYLAAFGGKKADSESLASGALRGFYTFNIDVYVDMDRKPGSGNEFTLPGRRVKIDPSYAWERAVILAPRPDAARGELLDLLTGQFPDRPKAEAEASIDQTMFFPKKIRVRGKAISFFVPKGFFGGSDGSDWAITVFVTGAKPITSLNASAASRNKKSLEDLEMGVMQPTPGLQTDTFGYAGDVAPTPIVDILAPTMQHQTAMLSSKSPLKGMSWGPHAANEIGTHPQPVAVIGGALPVVAEREKTFFSDLFGRFGRLLGDKPSLPARAGGPVPPIQTFLDSSNAASPPAATGMIKEQALPSTGAVPLPSVADRLQALQNLHDRKLIDEAEYKTQRQRILNQL